MKPLTPLLAPVSAIYGAATEVRLALYRRGLLRVAKLSRPVISVGNITTGGTGKTPLVEFIARALGGEGKKVCVLTRGYGRQKGGRVLVSDGERVLADEREAGDEPLLLAEKLLGISAVVCDANRFAAGDWATRELGSEVFVMDDGFQHLSLARDLDIVTIDATTPWGQGHLLPWGRLREPARGLSRADCVVITRADQADDVSTIRHEVNRLIPNKPVFTSHMEIRSLQRLSADQSESPDKMAEVTRPIAAFCAVGNPASFISLLQRGGYDPVSTAILPDHYSYKANDIANIVKQAEAAGANSLITTAKDAVKLHGFSFELPCYVLDIKVSIDDESRFTGLIYSSVAREPA